MKFKKMNFSQIFGAEGSLGRKFFQKVKGKTSHTGACYKTDTKKKKK